MSRFFIDRPIFAWVIAIVIMLAGILAIPKLPIEQYPDIAPPTISVNASYPGASAKIVEDSVTQIIEQRMTGLDGLQYIASSSSSSGSASISLSFSADTDPDIAQMQVQNKLQLALTQLPESVQRQGLRVTKSSSGFLVVLAFVSADGSMKQTDIADYITTNIQDSISRVEGVGNTQVFGAAYAMRIWLDPFKLTQYKLTTSEIKSAIQAQNTQVSAGQLGATPAMPDQQLNATVTAQSRLQTPEQFRAIVLKTAADGAVVRLSDVARVELGSENYDVISRYKGQPSSGLAVTLASGANALATAEAVRAKLTELEAYFPPGLKAEIPSDASPFIRISIKGVIITLLEAVALVFLVMLVFLQNFRATLIPTITVPVVLLGTMAVLYVAGYSINTLTLFGVVLAIGLLVDDAIVVVENVERLMVEEKLPAREATRKSMTQITGALVGIALVLSAVFVPMAFFGGSTGVIYRQFSITLVSAMGLSVLVALVLTPALCASLLKEKKSPPSPALPPQGVKGARKNVYQAIVKRMILSPFRYLIIYALIIGLMSFLFVKLPTSFLPDEDQGALFVQVRLPPGATQERTLKVIAQVEQHFMDKEKDVLKGMFATAGTGTSGNSQNVARVIVRLVDWSERPGADQTVQAVAQRATAAFKRIRDASVVANAPPAVRGLGNASGFEIRLQDRAGLGHEALVAARDDFVKQASQDERLTGVRANGQDDTAQYQIDLDIAQAGAMGVSIATINDTLSTAWGGSYVSDFIDKGRVKKVYVQGEASSRMLPDDLKLWFVRNASGEMVPFSAFATGRWVYGAPVLERFNGMSSMEITGAPAVGVSSGTAMQIAEDIIKGLPAGIGFEWSGMSAQERASGAQAPLLYAISMLVVFLALAALYESWSIPFSVMLVVPLGIVGALLATYTRGLSNDVYFQVGLLATIGLSAKNAILIVEFAKELMGQGYGLIEATLEAVRIRLRPILMTSLAFILGVLPLVISTGAGSGSQHSVGTGVMGGMIAATVLGIFFVPVFFVVVHKIVSRAKHH
ncbi:efflux RND transporter permease subunit [Thiothrix fructosivorans]|uniref:Efflux pump membrane transporter n=1 Tax=Thiothrix fructosivorans TaxID=111770 RepID=A0A8B0SIY6_9GAMM|nr:efflux RND transporter permease subunit [Thiothrix fructosivorans]MBO0613491.1 efflux RND transporter permease subunit [Thiothrix fructosivorans]QTX11081.1 efflux RND transporter permease subunit [Thiothrix fructosivorans]